jgi:hypothetical protein
LVGGRHELRSDRIGDRVCKDALDLVHRSGVDAPAHGLTDGRKLIGPTRSPQGDICVAAIEHPANREMDDPLAVVVVGKAIERLDRGEILPKARRLKFRVVPAQVVAGEAALMVIFPERSPRQSEP